MGDTVARKVVGICVGVDKPGLLHDLTAAGEGARQFHEWLLSQRELGVDVQSTLFTEKEGPVLRRNILDAITEVVKVRDCDVLFLYLAGHGVAHAAEDEKLLLSEAAKDSNEAVSVLAARQRGRTSGIPHVIIIYDACRTFATTESLQQVAGGSIFPPAKSVTKIGGHIDVFYGCARDESSFEIQENSAANPKKYRAFFTEVLLDALKSPRAELVEFVTLGNALVPVISCARLERMLERHVPELAADSQPPFEQSPDIDVLSHMPEEFFALAPSTAVAGTTPPGDSMVSLRLDRPPSTSPPTNSDVVGRDLALIFGMPPSGRTMTDSSFDAALYARAASSGFNQVRDETLKARGREGFETHCGFTVLGIEVTHFEVSNNDFYQHVSWDSRPGEQHYNVGPTPWGARAGTALIEFADGTGVALAVMPGYVGTVLVREGHVRALNYAVAKGTYEYQDYVSRRTEIEARRAVAAAAASIGKLDALGRQAGVQLADYIRVAKSLDPTLGVLAAYAYALNGNADGARSIYNYMANTAVGDWQGQQYLAPVPFDVAMLAGRMDVEATAQTASIAPCCPWMSIGWTMMELYEPKMHPAIVHAGRHRLPGTWTSFSVKGVEILRRALRAKEIA